MGKSQEHDPQLPIIFRKNVSGGWVQGSVDGNKQLVAKEYIHAPHHGDIAMRTLQRILQRIANTLHRPITHEYVAANKGSEALIRRTGGYVKTGTDMDGQSIYEKIIKPAPHR